MRFSIHTCKSIIAPFLGLAAAVFSSAALTQTAAAQPSPSLVYNSRSTTSSSGYSSYSSSSTGIMVVGPQFTEETEVWTGSGATNIPVTKREVQEYYISGSKTQKFYSKNQTSDQSGPNAKRVVGFFNMAPKNSVRPSLFFAIMPYDYTTSGLSETDGSIIGKATEQSPYAGAPKIQMAAVMQSSYRWYELNSDAVWDENGTPPELKNLGQDGTTRFASLMSGRTTYTHNSKLSELVKNNNFADACAAIEKWFQDNGYTNSNPVE